MLSWIPAARIVEKRNASELLDGFEQAIRTSVYLNWYHPHGEQTALCSLSKLVLIAIPPTAFSALNRSFLRTGGGGYEDVGAVEAVNCMLLLSIEGFLRFFPAWPLGEVASFHGLRASGAFIVSASVDATGTVSGVSLVAEAGGRCVFLNPWAGTAATAPTVRCAGAAVPLDTVAGGKFAFETRPGQPCTIAVGAIHSQLHSSPRSQPAQPRPPVPELGATGE